jgi:hypothetical protein
LNHSPPDLNSQVARIIGFIVFQFVLLVLLPDPYCVQMTILAGCWWLMPVILASQEAEIRRITVQSQPGEILQETLSCKNLSQKRTGGMTQCVCPEFKPQYLKKKKKKTTR